MPQLPNFPQPPARSFSSDTFPADLIQANRQFYTSLTFVDYSASLQGLPFASGAVGGGSSIRLPIPRKLNDNEVIMWDEDSLVQAGTQAIQGIPGVGPMIARSLSGGLAGAAQAAYPAGSAYSGLSINPFQFMYFRRPGYKEFTLQWTLAPNSQQESETLKNIIIQCKKAALPQGTAAFGAALKYPKIAIVELFPVQYLFKFKPCAIISVQVDYTGAGPSFFRSNAPTIVNLNLHLKEIQLWKADDPDLNT